MKNLLTIIVLVLGFCQTANADVWKWTDARGNTHFVDTMTPIFTWVDESDKTYYSDTPDHEDAIRIVLVWYAKGDLDGVGENTVADESGGYAYPGETAEDRAQREEAEAYYCKRATEIFDSYINAPRLFNTGPDGERQYLSEEAAAATIAETKAKKDELCK
jgi:hypothetical protein